MKLDFSLYCIRVSVTFPRKGSLKLEASQTFIKYFSNVNYAIPIKLGIHVCRCENTISPVLLKGATFLPVLIRQSPHSLHFPM